MGMIFLLNFDHVNFSFGTFIFTLNAHKNVQKLLNITMFVSKVFNAAFLIGDSVELPKWLKSGSGTKKSAKSIFFWLVEGSLSIGCNLGSECSEC